MKGKIIPMLMLMLGVNTTTLLAQDECCPVPVDYCCDSGFSLGNLFSNLTAVSQLGIAYEQHNNYGEAFIYWDQLINDHWYYELRLVGIRDWIVNSPPTVTAPAIQPTVKDERNLWGGGGIWIFGYQFELCPRLTLLPFYRGQVITNVATNYKDKYGNEQKSVSWTNYGGLKVAFKVTDDFSVYTQWYGGYRRINYHGKGFWATPSHVHVNALHAVWEMGAPWKVHCPCLCDSTFVITPYIQWNFTDNNPTTTALAAPWKLSGLTSNETVFAVKIAYQF